MILQNSSRRAGKGDSKGRWPRKQLITTGDNWSFIPLGTAAHQYTTHSLDLTQPGGKEAEIFTHQLLSVIGCRQLPGGINSLALQTCHAPVIGLWCGLPEKSLRQREIYAGKSHTRRCGWGAYSFCSKLLTGMWVALFIISHPRVPLGASAFRRLFLAFGRLPFYFLVFWRLRSVYWECTFQQGVIIGYEREVKAFLLKALIEYLQRNICRVKYNLLLFKRCFWYFLCFGICYQSNEIAGELRSGSMNYY